MRVIELVEYAPLPGVHLSVADRDALLNSDLGISVQPDFGQRDVYTLTSGSQVGALRVNDMIVELRPKVGLAPVLFMLAFAASRDDWSPNVVPLSARPYFADAVAELFALLAEDAIRPGVLRGYVDREDTLSTIRGRVLMSTQMTRRAGLPLPIELTYNDYTADIPENRVLVSTIGCLRRLGAGRIRAEQRLRRLGASFDDVTPLDPSVVRASPEPRWTRLNQRYQPAVRLGRLILSGAGVDLVVGATEARGLVLNMNDIFEQFMRTALRRSLSLSERDFPDQAKAPVRYLSEGRAVRLKPDLTWWDTGTCVMVGDCKYKRPRGAIPNADVYQAVSYLSEYGQSDGWLIYASGEVRERDLLIPSLRKTIHVRTVDVAQDPKPLLSSVQTLAEEIRSRVRRSVLGRPA